MSLDFRTPTIAEMFPLVAKQQLLNIQSTHLVNQSLLKGGLTEGLSEMPLELAINANQGVIIDSAVAPSLIGIYVKNNWPILLLAVVIGGTAVYFLIEANKKNAMPATLQAYKKEQEK